MVGKIRLANKNMKPCPAKIRVVSKYKEIRNVSTVVGLLNVKVKMSKSLTGENEKDSKFPVNIKQVNIYISCYAEH